MGYLDQDGLAYLWQKINTAIDEKLEGVTAQEVYSTEEQRIGTWIDGKPLYKKTVPFTTPSTHEQTDVFYIQEADVAITAYGHLIDSSSNICFFQCSFTGDAIVNMFLRKSNNAICFQCTSNHWLSRPAWMTVLYTKTTDTATTALSAKPDATIQLSTSALDLSSIQTAPVTAAAAGVEIAKMEEV